MLKNEKTDLVQFSSLSFGALLTFSSQTWHLLKLIRPIGDLFVFVFTQCDTNRGPDAGLPPRDEIGIKGRETGNPRSGVIEV